jgi:hypothetical protein
MRVRTLPRGELGAATIVGSAAFNLLFISAVCMLSVPKGEVRRISNLKAGGPLIPHQYLSIPT